MFSKLEAVESRFKEIEYRLADPELAGRQNEFRALTQEHASLGELVATFQKYKVATKDLSDNKSLLSEKDPEMVAMAKDEIRRLEPEIDSLEKELQLLLLPQDPNDLKNIILEIRAGAGGDEAGLFVAELFRAYQKYADRCGWRLEVLSSSPTGIGGLKEIIAGIDGHKVYSYLKWEAGVHRVQRVPTTETQGRVHTSTITVAVLPEAEEVDLHINPADLRIDVYRSSGAGGQSVNTTDSAVRITHIPTNTVVTCQDERSQHKNKDKALKILRSRLLEVKQEAAAAAESAARKTMVGTGDRSERIRTYNFPQGRLTDHRIGLTLYQLPDIMEGHIDPILSALRAHYQTEALKAQGLANDKMAQPSS